MVKISVDLKIKRDKIQIFREITIFWASYLELDITLKDSTQTENYFSMVMCILVKSCIVFGALSE